MYQTIADAYRKNNITLLELRFNPMKRNTGGEQDLDDIMMAAARGDRQGVPRVLGEDGADRLLRQDVRPRSE